MSYVPYTPKPRPPVTGSGPFPPKLLCGTIQELAGMLAARAQWWMVGSALPANFAYAAASYQLTPATGKSPWPGG